MLVFEYKIAIPSHLIYRDEIFCMTIITLKSSSEYYNHLKILRLIRITICMRLFTLTKDRELMLVQEVVILVTA